MSFLGFLLFAFSLVVVLHWQAVVCSVMEEELAQALHGKHIQGALAGLDQVSQPRHGLGRGLRRIRAVQQLQNMIQNIMLTTGFDLSSLLVSHLSLDDVEKEVWVSAATQEVSQTEGLVQALHLILDLGRRSARWTPECEQKQSCDEENYIFFCK